MGKYKDKGINPMQIVFDMIPDSAPCIDCYKHTTVKRENYPAMGKVAFYCVKCQRAARSRAA